MFRAAIFALLLAYASAFSAPVGVHSRVASSRVAFKPAIAMNAIEEKVKAIIAEQLGVDAAKVTPDASFTEDLGADSLDAVEVREYARQTAAHAPRVECLYRVPVR